MDRLRVGLTGLGAVFLLTLGVSLTFGHSQGNAQLSDSRKEPGEPLAQLGVAPGAEKSMIDTTPYGQPAPLTEQDLLREEEELRSPRQDSPIGTPPVAAMPPTSSTI